MAYWRQHAAIALFVRGARAMARLGKRAHRERVLQLLGATLLLATVALAGAPQRAAADSTPNFGAFTSNPFGLSAVGYFTAPAFADIDGDGDLDAFVGESNGNTVFIRNTGTANAPAYAASSANPFGLSDVGNHSAPAFADIDADGDLDAFVGNTNGNVLFFRNTGTAVAPALAASSSNPFGLSDVGSYSVPAFADIDGDGDLDAFIGGADGNTDFFRNTGSALSPAFAASSSNPFGLSDAGEYSAPAFADIDSDGDLDAFVGERFGNTVFFRNTGSATEPAFATSSANPFGLSDAGFYSKPAFTDIDGDGDLDAIVGRNLGGTILFGNNAAFAQRHFAPLSSNPFGLSDVGGSSAPAFADIDADGDMDAFIGAADGNTAYFGNTGSATAPAFAASSANPFGLSDVGSYSAPAFADIDGDGDQDVFVGEFPGNTTFFRNTGTANAPAFGASSSNPFGLSDVGLYSAPAFADIDGDGDLDAFIGNSDGNTVFFRNTGGATAPAFAAASSNPFGLSDVGLYSAPAFADIDGDGDQDAFVGEFSGNTVFLRNTGTANVPGFAAPLANPFGLSDVGSYSAPVFADIDGDGDLDAFVGASNGNTVFFRAALWRRYVPNTHRAGAGGW